MCAVLLINKYRKMKTKLCVDIKSNEIDRKYKKNIARKII